MANLGEMTKLWELAYLQESAQLCVLHILYADLYKSLFSKFPHRGLLHHKSIFVTHLEGPQTRLLSLLQLYVAFTICIRNQTCN